MAKFIKSVKFYILLGYITLIGIASVTVWVIYNETLDLYANQVDMNPVSEKIFLANTILMNLYEAENLERNYLQTGNEEHYQSYNYLIDSISSQINLLGSIVGNPSQIMHTDSIQKLLTQKRENLKELNLIKNSVSSEKIHERALIRLTQNKDSLNHLFEMYKSATTGKDTSASKQKQARFFEQLINVFSPPQKRDTASQANSNKVIPGDSIFNSFNPTDSVEQIMASIFEEVRNESVKYERQLIQKEQENLENAQIITMQIRQILTQLENEEILSSLKKVSVQQGHITRMTNIVIVLGAAALLIIVGFVILILKDITRSQHYRQNLEKEKAYSESLLKSKEQFMLSITHDLKSPLNSIAGFTTLAEKEKDPKQQKKYLKNIESSASYIARLINDLLDFARLETGNMSIDQHEVNLDDLLEEVVSAFYPIAQAKNIALNLEIDQLEDKTYLTDGTRLNQVISNLISNAIKFTDKGFVHVKASIVKSKGKTDYVTIDVEDTGIGISEENSNLIFEEFGRITSTDNVQYEGTGLGLTITKRIIEILNGTIKLSSFVGKGSKFTIILPLQKATSKSKIISPNINSNKQPEVIIFNKEHVLLADDDPFLLELTTHILKEANLSVLPFTAGKDALHALKNHSFDLLITDVQMPGVDGYDLLATVRQNLSENIPAIAVTGESNNLENYLKAGFNLVLQKPFQPQELLSAVANCLNIRNEKDVPIAPSNSNGRFKYSIEGIKAFAEGEDDTLKEILISLAQSTADNLTIFRHQINEENFEEIKKLAHKMLPMFRQLEADSIVEPLIMLEQDSYQGKERVWKETCLQLIPKIENLMHNIIEEHQLPFSGKLIS